MLFEPAQHADMRESSSAAATQRDTDTWTRRGRLLCVGIDRMNNGHQNEDQD